MKKLLVVVAVASLFLCAGCSKTCKCSAKLNDEVLSEKTVELNDGEKCSDYNTSVTVLGQTAQLKCTPQLF
ncbi:MAG: hypothetical protein PHD11_02540 [Bacteroidales bacterium]|nr:hypothetical protein [Bacteroidales bacterium]MDD4670177.1 hypothetical protein [Bacteroidales bacterium]